jgi:hypothetical protein
LKTRHRHAHRRIWVLLAFVLPAILAVALVLKPLGRAPEAPIELEPAKDKP